ncbi:MAG: methyltransferase domain-containing protein [Chthoniobacterales bacterium]
MLETSNPEINVVELMEKIRHEAARIAAEPRRPAALIPASVSRQRPTPRSAPPPVPDAIFPPTLGISNLIEAKPERLQGVLEKARAMIQVSKAVPRMFRGLFRRQGGFNRALLETLHALAKTSVQLSHRTNELMLIAQQQHDYLYRLAENSRGQTLWMKSSQSIVSELEQTLTKTLANLHAEASATNEQLRSLEREHGNILSVHGEQLRSLEREHENILSVHGEQLRRLHQEMDQIGEHLRNLQGTSDRQAQDLARLQTHAEVHTNERIHLEQLRHSLALLEERQANDAIYVKGELGLQSALLHRQPSVPGVGAASETSAPDSNRLDAFYFSFENRFRGPRAEIKKRLEFYLPLIREADAGATARPVLDLGCGRGEWLELLQENGLSAVGVDLNRAMVAQCAQRNLFATEADAVAHLRQLDEGSCGAVTGFHVIEHLPLETLVDLIAEARRVLQPGGVAIFESPNCKNLTVGACNFNIDPTHRNPVFPETAEFILETQGFENIRLEYLSPAAGSPFAGGDPNSVALTALLYGPQDFAVIGFKPKAK